MDNMTYGDLMSEYQLHKEAATRFHDWKQLDKFMETLMQKVALPKAQPLARWSSYAFNSEGTPLHEDHSPISFDPIDGKRIE